MLLLPQHLTLGVAKGLEPFEPIRNPHVPARLAVPEVAVEDRAKSFHDGGIQRSPSRTAQKPASIPSRALHS